ncbi:DUF2842 domain-containing protein [Methylocapsa acidiphila]|uniref:DUF2842 domain-containing protein n=1 Tax=Methylocapsa acidiphila TaxID=133552 RepID=UPI0003FB2702|nr:DUF2842 domain-containing protein [Methylocapsa acidiphila]
MRRRIRKLIGAAVTLGFALAYALLAMVLAQGLAIREMPEVVRGLILAALGLAWIFPLMPLIKWMERPDD